MKKFVTLLLAAFLLVSVFAMTACTSYSDDVLTDPDEKAWTLIGTINEWKQNSTRPVMTAIAVTDERVPKNLRKKVNGAVALYVYEGLELTVEDMVKINRDDNWLPDSGVDVEVLTPDVVEQVGNDKNHQVAEAGKYTVIAGMKVAGQTNTFFIAFVKEA